MFTALNVAAAIINERPSKKISTHLLMYELYIIQKTHIKEKGEPLFEEDIIKDKSYTFPCVESVLSKFDPAAGASIDQFKEFLIPETDELKDIIEPLTRMTSIEVTKLMKDDPLWTCTVRGSKIIFKPRR